MAQLDDEVFNLHAKSDEETIRFIFDRCYAGLCVVACFYTNDTADAEDIVQQVLIKMWEGKHFRNINSSLTSYLRSAVINACLNHLEKKKAEQLRINRLPDQKTVAEAIDFLMDEEEKAMFEKALSEIPSQCKRAIELVYFAGQPYKKAADAMNISINTIKSHLKTGLRKIKVSPEINHYFADKKKQ
jgi:RNA polymerase sigma-70 factor (family 1)